MEARIPARSFEDLIVWQKAHAFVLWTYKFTDQFPKHEVYGLASQFRRAAVSIPANIAEGFRRQTSIEKSRFLNIAQGSLEECRYYLILARDLHYGDPQAAFPMLVEVSKLLEAYRSAIGRER
jgi:four helix bundle protein